MFHKCWMATILLWTLRRLPNALGLQFGPLTPVSPHVLSQKPLTSSTFTTAANVIMTTNATKTTTTTAASAAASPNKPVKEFKTTLYKRELPSTCTAFNSRAGKRRLASALATGGLRSFFALMEQHATQSEPAYCGLATLIVVLNAFAVDPQQAWKQGVPWRWYQDEAMLNCCLDLEQVQEKGITLSDFSCLAICQGLSVDTRHAEDSESGSLQEFRKAVQLACVEEKEEEQGSSDEKDNDNMTPRHILVVSYNRSTLGQTGTGHFSPIAAYDGPSDSVLILDTARFKYGAHWVPLELLHQAMLPPDPATQKSRGFVILSPRPEDATHEQEQLSQHNLPISILFRFKFDVTAQKLQAQFYNQFLRQPPNSEQVNPDNCKMTASVTWEDVLRYWTDNGTNLSKIYKILEPQLKPPDAATRQLVQIILDQIQQLLSEASPDLDQLTGESSTSLQTASSSRQCANHNSKKTACRPNLSRTLALGPEQAIFLVFLSSLKAQERQGLLELAFPSNDGTKNDKNKMAREQLLASAEMLETVFGLAVSQQQQQKEKPSEIKAADTNGS